MPAVSVIIPNCNHGKYLKQRIDSVLEQSYTDIEVIILDDNSTDNSKAVIEGYRNEKRITQIVFNTENSGNPFNQWNKGIEIAQGKYIWIAESDDWCEPVFLETIMSGLENNKEAVIGYCQSYSVSDNGRISFQSNHARLKEYIDGKKFISEYIIPRNPIFNASMAVWKKEVYKRISKDFIDYKRIGDYLFWIELSNWGQVFISGKLLNYFRKHDNNVSGHAFKNGLSFIDQIPLYKKLLDRKLINLTDHHHAMKKLYLDFRLSKKNIPAETNTAITKLFAKFGGPVTSLKLYFYMKQLQLLSKKVLRA